MATPNPAFRALPVVGAAALAAVEHEVRLQKLLLAFIRAGLFFMLLPGTFLGVWNLLSISSRHTVETLSPAWLQAHGHAQIFGWIGTFILGIGFYSLSKMGNLLPFAVSRGWTCFGLWICGAGLRWSSGVFEWHWRLTLPLSALLELAGFLLFFRTVSSHRPRKESEARKPEPWMILVMASTFGFLASLALNAGADLRLAWIGVSPELPHVFDQRLVALEVWCFLTPAIWDLTRAGSRRFSVWTRHGASGSLPRWARCGRRRLRGFAGSRRFQRYCSRWPL